MGPDVSDPDVITYYPFEVPAEEVAATATRLQELERLLAHPLPVEEGPFLYWVTVLRNGQLIRKSSTKSLKMVDEIAQLVSADCIMKVERYEYKDEWTVPS
jgi:hypothetical protein